MRIKILNNTAFSLLEILLASIIFIVSIGGVFVTLHAVRKPVADKESALSAAVFGKQVLEDLRSTVNAGGSANYYANCPGSICTDFSLALGTHQVSQGNLPTGLSWPQDLVTVDNVNYPNGNPPVLIYSVTCADGSPNSSCGADTARKVNLDINWPSAP